MTDEEYKWFLRNEVVDAGLCTFCGPCAAICPNEAIEKEHRYTMWIGANDARRPADGIFLKSFCTTEEIPELIDAVAGTFVKYRTKPGRERLGNVIANVGEGRFLKEVLDQM